MRPTDKATGHWVVLYSLSLSLKTLDTGISLLAVFTLELEMDHPPETSLCADAPSPTDTPSPIFSYWRRRLYTGYQKRIIHIQTVRQNWRIKSGGLFIQKLKPHRFETKTCCLSDANYQTDNPSQRESPVSRVKTAISVINECHALGLKYGVRVLNWLLACKIILEVEYFIKSMIYQMLKFFRRIALHPEMILLIRPLFYFKHTKNTGSLTFNSLKQKKLIFNFFVNRNCKKFADNRKSHHPMETLWLLVWQNE